METVCEEDSNPRLTWSLQASSNEGILLTIARSNPALTDEDIAPLSDAARTEAMEMVRLLVTRGSDVNARDANGTHTRTEPLPRLCQRVKHGPNRCRVSSRVLLLTASGR